ncbi:MAG: 2-oxoacid:acceptor oxidoreductase family protein [Candidatus Zixiibacteriota bacterium]
MLTELRITGFGGQGVIRFGYLLGKAASIYDGKQATMTQSFGPEARGSACSSQVVISDDRVLYPYVTVPHVVVVMSQEGFVKHAENVKEGGIVIIDEDLVKPERTKKGVELFAIPSTRFAEEMGVRIVANIVMFGFFTAVTGLVKPESARKAIESSFREKLIDLNLKAFDKGYQYGKEQLTQKAGAKSGAQASR